MLRRRGERGISPGAPLELGELQQVELWRLLGCCWHCGSPLHKGKDACALERQVVQLRRALGASQRQQQGQRQPAAALQPVSQAPEDESGPSAMEE